MSKVINITGRNYSSKYSLQGKELFESRLQMNSSKRKVHLPITSKINNDSNQLGSSSYINTDNMSNFRNILITSFNKKVKMNNNNNHNNYTFSNDIIKNVRQNKPINNSILNNSNTKLRKINCTVTNSNNRIINNSKNKKYDKFQSKKTKNKKTLALHLNLLKNGKQVNKEKSKSTNKTKPKYSRNNLNENILLKVCKNRLNENKSTQKNSNIGRINKKTHNSNNNTVISENYTKLTKAKNKNRNIKNPISKLINNSIKTYTHNNNSKSKKLNSNSSIRLCNNNNKNNKKNNNNKKFANHNHFISSNNSIIKNINIKDNRSIFIQKLNKIKSKNISKKSFDFLDELPINNNKTTITSNNNLLNKCFDIEKKNKCNKNSSNTIYENEDNNFSLKKIETGDKINDLDEEEESGILSIEEVQDIIKSYNMKDVKENFLFSENDYDTFNNKFRDTLIKVFFNDKKNKINKTSGKKNITNKKVNFNNIKSGDLHGSAYLVLENGKCKKLLKK